MHPSISTTSGHPSYLFVSLLFFMCCSKGLFVLMPFPPQKTQLSLKPRLIMDVLPNSAMSRLASSLSLVAPSSYVPIKTIVPSCMDLRNSINGATFPPHMSKYLVSNSSPVFPLRLLFHLVWT
uniref:Protein FAM3C n=1 Tax=Sus scrofa TaxID=9823 RepID=A0A480J476_PIG